MLKVLEEAYKAEAEEAGQPLQRQPCSSYTRGSSKRTRGKAVWFLLHTVLSSMFAISGGDCVVNGDYNTIDGSCNQIDKK